MCGVALYAALYTETAVVSVDELREDGAVKLLINQLKKCSTVVQNRVIAIKVALFPWLDGMAT
jgi:hypothetical protein